MNVVQASARGVAVVAVWLLAALPAWADVTKQECIDANTKAQSLEHDGKLIVSRRESLICASPSCQVVVGDDCAKRLAALSQRIPSIVFDVTDGDGKDLPSATVTMDHEPFVSDSIEAAISVDPGEHVFEFKMDGLHSVERHIVVREGEKNRRERITLTSRTMPPEEPVFEPVIRRSPPPYVASPASRKAVAVGDTSPERRSGRITGVVLIGVGLSFIGATAVLGYLGSRQNAAISDGGFASGSNISNADGVGDALNIAFGISLASSVLLEAVGLPLLLANLGRSPKVASASNIQLRGHGVAIRW